MPGGQNDDAGPLVTIQFEHERHGGPAYRGTIWRLPGTYPRDGSDAVRAELLRWELLGILLVFFSGSALHFAFEWCGRTPLVAPFAAVNESVWEHLKLAFWPSVAYASMEYCFFGRHMANFVIAKAVGIALMPLTIVLLFYCYTALVGHHVLWLDILIFFIAVAAGQLASCEMLIVAWPQGRWRMLGLIALVLLAVGFAVFTFWAPRLAIFRDSTTGTYGVGS